VLVFLFNSKYLLTLKLIWFSLILSPNC